jgi:hypothetical protein
VRATDSGGSGPPVPTEEGRPWRRSRPTGVIDTRSWVGDLPPAWLLAPCSHRPGNHGGYLMRATPGLGAKERAGGRHIEEGCSSLPREHSLFSVLAILGAPGPAFKHQARPLSLRITSLGCRTSRPGVARATARGVTGWEVAAEGRRQATRSRQPFLLADTASETASKTPDRPMRNVQASFLLAVQLRGPCQVQPLVMTRGVPPPPGVGLEAVSG